MLINADCLKHLNDIPSDAAIITDPPWGVNTDTDYTRFTMGKFHSRNNWPKIEGDNKPFDPSPWLNYKYICLWGANHFAQTLPPGSWLVWLKKRDCQIGHIVSDCELAWMNKGKGVWLFKHIWSGFDRETERGKTLHPTQKPVALFKWVIERMRLPKDTVIVDPYAGSGACLMAAKELGYKYIGFEIDQTYYNIATERLNNCIC